MSKAEAIVAQVVIPPLHTSYSYSVPEELLSVVQLGSSVEVPFGARKTHGFVVDVAPQAKDTATKGKGYTLKNIAKLPQESPCFSSEQLELFQWVARYYGAPLANVINVAVPAAVQAKVERMIRYIKAPDTALRGSVQKRLFEYLAEQTSPTSYDMLKRQFRNCLPALKKLESMGVIAIEETDDRSSVIASALAPEWAKDTVQLDASQKMALQSVGEAINADAFAPFLLHGVTGSGKTEVYIEAIQAAHANGKGALVIVPEIALTPQLVDRFAARLKVPFALLHSALSKRERWNYWQALLQGHCTIAIGARSGIFAPVKNLGLIIVDEEHDSSYKQSDGLRYHARDIAVMRAQFCNCPVVLGSATPSLETFHNALRKKYQYISLPSRHKSGSALQIDLVDLSNVPPWEMPSSNISPQLFEALSSILSKGQQAFILYNRRGFASYLQCDTCSTVIECPNCSVTLTYHHRAHTLKCHYCNFTAIPGEHCNTCSQSISPDSKKKPGKLVQRGGGTEKVYDELQELFPQYSCERLDRDIASKPEVYQEILARVRSGETKILVGTQMIAKGHDLPGVTLVGIINCDIGLHMPDFRSAERVFQLLTQASGRAGRGETPGSVLLQTRVPEHVSVQKTLTRDYAGFAKVDLRTRKELGYPPYGKLLRIIASSEDSSVAQTVLSTLQKSLSELIERETLQVSILGPTAAPIQKLKTLYRWHIILKSASSKDLHKLLNVLKTVRTPKNCRFILDRDPQDLL